MSKLNIRLTSLAVIAVVVVAVLLAFSPRVQASLGLSNEGEFCIMFLEPVPVDSTEPSPSTDLGCYKSFEEAFSQATAFGASQTDLSSSEESSSIESSSQATAFEAIYPELSSSEESSSIESSSLGNYCVIFLEPVPVDSDKPSKSTDRGCYESFQEAILVATDGTVKLSSDILPQDLTQEMLDAQRNENATTPIVIGIDYDYTNYTGSLKIYSVNQSCSPSMSYWINNMPSGWNDRVSSAQNYGGCDLIIHYEHSNLGGANLTCTTPGCPSMGIMNNATSSLKWLD